MIVIKSEWEIERMKEAGRILKEVLRVLEKEIRPGIKKRELDRIAEKEIRRRGGKPSFKGYMGYPASICVSVDEVVIHGIPDGTILHEGEIVGIDLGVEFRGYHADAARTYPVGKVDKRKLNLIKVAEGAFFAALEFAREGMRIGDISHAIESYAKKHGCDVVRMFTGHGIGKKLHEDPPVPNFGNPGTGPRLRQGMTLAIETMITEGSGEVEILKDGWTVVTKDRKLSAHYENTIVITDGEPEILTL